jgi:hypothetical protein
MQRLGNPARIGFIEFITVMASKTSQPHLNQLIRSLPPWVQGEITQITEDAMRALPTSEIVDRVTVVRGYQELACRYPDRYEYIRKLSKAILSLAHLAEHSGEPVLAGRFRSIVPRMN